MGRAAKHDVCSMGKAKTWRGVFTEMKKVKGPYFGSFWIRKRGKIYIANANWFKAFTGVASPSIMTFLGQSGLKELFDGTYAY